MTDAPDKYVSELDEETREEWVRSSEETEVEIESMESTIRVSMSSILLTRMVQQDYITLREYADLIDKVIDYADDNDIAIP